MSAYLTPYLVQLSVRQSQEELRREAAHRRLVADALRCRPRRWSRRRTSPCDRPDPR